MGKRNRKSQILVQRNYKDTVFRKLFSDKESLLSLYNAVAKKDYKSYDNLPSLTVGK